MIVVGATRVKADNEIGDLDAGSQKLDVVGQIGRTRLLRSLNKDQATSMGKLLLMKVRNGGDGAEDGISVVSTSATVELAILDDRLIRTKSLSPGEHGGLLIQVTIHQNGAVGRKKSA